MADSSTFRGRLLAAVALFLACAGLGWFLMAVQTPDENDHEVMRRQERCIEAVLAVERAAESPSADEEAEDVLALASPGD